MLSSADLMIPLGSVLRSVTSLPVWDWKQRCELLYFIFQVAPKVTAQRDLEAKRGKKKKKFVQLQTKWEEARLLGKMGAEGLEQGRGSIYTFWGKNSKVGSALLPFVCMGWGSPLAPLRVPPCTCRFSWVPWDPSMCTHQPDPLPDSC